MFLQLACWLLQACVSDGDSPRAEGALEGRLHVRVLDTGEGARRQYSVITHGGLRVRVSFPSDPGLGAGNFVELQGRWSAPERFAADHWTLRTGTIKRRDAPLARTPVHHRVAVIAMQEAAVSERVAMRAANGSTASLQHFYAETSRGLDTFSAEVFRRYDIEYTQDNCLYDNSYDISDALIRAFEADGFDPRAYDHLAFIVPRSCGSDWTGAWADEGLIGDGGQLRPAVVSMYKDDSFDPWFLAHELGHNLGMRHSKSLNCGDAVYVPGATGCEVREYGNYNDVMGWGSGVYWGTPHQRFMGWMPAERVVTVHGDGTFHLQPADGADCGLQALRIPIPSEPGVYFYVEYRRARSDSLYAGTGEWGGTRHNALLITRSDDTAGDRSANQRMELGTSRYRGAEAGGSYTLGDGIALDVGELNGPSARVVVRAAGTGSHVRDDGLRVEPAEDGSFGVPECGRRPAEGGEGDAPGSGAGTDACPDAGSAGGCPQVRVYFPPATGSEPDYVIELRIQLSSGEYEDPAAAFQDAEVLAHSEMVELKRRWGISRSARKRLKSELKSLAELARAEGSRIIAALGGEVH